MSPGTEQNLDNMFFAQMTSTSYEELCCMDVQGLEDNPNGHQSVVYEEFIEQLSHSPEGWYWPSLERGSSPITLQQVGKLESTQKTSPSPLKQQWQKREISLPKEVSCPRALTSTQGPIEKIELHAFGVISRKGITTAVNAVVKQSSTLNQGLVKTKARQAKQGLTIPRRELVSCHLAVNLLRHFKFSQ